MFLFQVVVVQAISALCQKYPRKHSVMMNFLSNMLRDDVSYITVYCLYLAFDFLSFLVTCCIENVVCFFITDIESAHHNESL